MSSPNKEKPPYCIPGMDEIRALTPNGYKVVSTFSGAGGSCLGFKMAGFEVLYASEFISAARETYARNFPDVPVDDKDIRKVKPEEILEITGLERGELDVLEGSPPCASFSTAGKREKSWTQVKKYSDTEQRTDDLFFEFSRILDGLQPRVFVAENVSGLVKGTAKGYFKEILRALKDCGYNVGAKLLDAQWLGVPQSRQRIIFVGVRKDLLEKSGVSPAWPRPLTYRYSVRDALPHILHHGTAPPHQQWVKSGRNVDSTLVAEATSVAPTILQSGENKGTGYVESLPVRVIHDTSGQFSQGDVTDRPCPAITVGVNSLNSEHYKVVQGSRFILKATSLKDESKSMDEPAPTVQAHGIGDVKSYQATIEDVSISRFAIGKEWDKLKSGESSDKYFNLVKPDPDKPSPTVTQTGGVLGAASVTHPTERRKFTIAELKRICAFPDDFELTGTYAKQWERLGRSVPPVMMYHVARTVRDEILAKCVE